MKISLYDSGILDFYLMYFDFKLKSAAQEQGHGIALKNIPPFDVLKRYLIPIPPIQEQKRIILEKDFVFSGPNLMKLGKWWQSLDFQAFPLFAVWESVSHISAYLGVTLQ